MRFKAAMFDFDGTLTDKGIYRPSQNVADALVKLSRKMPIGICTGRQLESFIRRGLKSLLEEISSQDRPNFLKNLFLFAENGAVGYRYDVKADKFIEFYKKKWPRSFYDKNKLKKILNEKVKGVGEVYDRAHRVIIVIRTILHDYENKDIDEVYRLSDKIFEIVVKTLKKIAPDYKKYVHVGNSGIGVIICPADADKDQAIKSFADFLNKNRGFDFGEKAREILAVGDQADLNGNDYYFLNGTYGTPYTVGDFTKTNVNKHLKTVINDKGKRLLHSEGTLYLINSLF